LAIDVTPQELRDTATSVRRGSDDVQHVLSSLAAHVQALSWRGSASEGFQSMFQEWQQGAQQVREAMDGIASLLAQAAQAYEDTDAGIRANTGH
jgi:WXG100 family type VII secretion target